jgi:indolepyruvate ferredoxin oxidoreductase, beta subunit
MPELKQKQFNIIIFGVGGQGLITLLKIISEAAKIQGYDIKTSELHGLSQRGGSVDVHLKFGKKIYSPLIGRGKADLILSLETQESLRGIYFANQETKFLINELVVPIPFEKFLDKNKVLAILGKANKNIDFVPAAALCREKLGRDVFSGIYLLSYAVSKKIIPLKPDSVLKAIKKVIPKKYLELNIKAFGLAYSSDSEG